MFTTFTKSICIIRYKNLRGTLGSIVEFDRCSQELILRMTFSSQNLISYDFRIIKQFRFCLDLVESKLELEMLQHLTCLSLTNALLMKLLKFRFLKKFKNLFVQQLTVSKSVSFHMDKLDQVKLIQWRETLRIKMKKD